MKIANIIEPIKLLKGTHDDTDKTGQGCFMNVIAYLNGEPQITDKSECVCFVVRPIAIWFNDFLRDDERHILVPFIERAMGSRTNDRAEIERRAMLAADMAQRMSVVAAKSAESAAKYAAKYDAEYAKYAAKYAAEYAAESAALAAKYAAEYAAEYAALAKSAAEYAAESAALAAKSAEYAAEYAALAKSAAEYAAESAALAAKSAEYAAEYAAMREEIKSACLDFLDKSLPQQEQGPVVRERAMRLRELVVA